MKNIRNGIPSFITSLGLISGCISIVMSATRGDLVLAGYFILIAALFDFLDGMAARLLHAMSEFGKQLDSLADGISFGVAPAMILYRLMTLSFVNRQTLAGYDVMHPGAGEWMLLGSTFLVAAFSALRLAKFNLDTTQVKEFRGLPTPANALFFTALGFIAERGTTAGLSAWIFNPWFLLVLIVLSCFLLVSNIRMFSLKFSSLRIRENGFRYAFLLLSAILLAVYRLPGLAGVIPLYIGMSLLHSLVCRKKS
jgi:CDP-diacylglycerol---serine O-phosphatidyltransferase